MVRYYAIRALAGIIQRVCYASCLISKYQQLLGLHGVAGLGWECAWTPTKVAAVGRLLEPGAPTHEHLCLAWSRPQAAPEVAQSPMLLHEMGVARPVHRGHHDALEVVCYGVVRAMCLIMAFASRRSRRPVHMQPCRLRAIAGPLAVHAIATCCSACNCTVEAHISTARPQQSLLPSLPGSPRAGACARAVWQ